MSKPTLPSSPSTNEIKSYVRYQLKRGEEAEDIFRDIGAMVEKSDLVHVIAQLLQEIREPRIGGTFMVKGPRCERPMRVEMIEDPSASGHEEILSVRTETPSGESEAVVSIAPHDDRIEIDVAWGEDKHPVMRNMIYDDEMSAGSSKAGEEFTLRRPDYYEE